MQFDEKQVRLWYKSLKNNKDLVEIRLLKKNAKPYSGYFTNIDVILSELKKFYDDNYHVYFTLNEVHPSCYNKIQRDKLQMGGSTTGDDQISKRTCLFIDFDPVRIPDTSSTNAQLKESARRALDVEKFLSEYGFPEPIHGLSGNGCHLLYDIDIPNNDKTKETFKRFYNTIAGLFSDRMIDIDKSVFNASRIGKVFGTYARKGANTEEAPHRLSKITSIPKDRKKVSLTSIMIVANLLPTKEEVAKYAKFENPNGTGVDVDGFLQKHNIAVKREESYHGGRKIVLEHCVYNEAHKAPDAVIFVSSEGIPSYHCSHNSCADKNGWHNLREHFEPDFYKQRENNRNQNNRYNNFQNYSKYRGGTPTPDIQQEVEELGHMWLDPMEIEYVDTSKLVSIPTGFKRLDSKIIGMYLGELSITTGRNAAGKSSWLNQVALNAISSGFKVGIWSGELDDKRLMPWISLAAAGPSNVIRDETKENFYYVDSKTDQRIKRWLSKKLYIYNNKYFSKWEQIKYALDILVKKGVKLFILDNLMAMDISGFEGDSNEKQKQFLLGASAFCKQNDVHVIIVAHPRKEMTFLRKESIAGSGDISNLVDNIFIVHRVNQDFSRRAPEFLGQMQVDSCLEFSNVVEVAKNRAHGIEDHIAGMFYDVKSKRFLNEKYEDIRYAWETYEDAKAQQLPF